MNNLQITQRILAYQFGVEECEITEDIDIFTDLGGDSLDRMELVLAFEDEFDIEIDLDEAEQITTVGDILRALEKHGQTAFGQP